MIIGLTGPIGAGTDSAGKTFVEMGFKWFSFSDILREEAKKRGMKINRTNLQDLGDELRKKHGSGILSKLIIKKMKDGENYVIGNIRNPGELEELRKMKDFALVMIDAPRKLRFQRIRDRKRENDPKTFEEFLKLEEKDFGVGQENYGQQHANVFKMADFKILNDNTFAHLKEKIENFLQTNFS